ncbi:MAG: GIY-YIG nuclease family protein [Bacteroidota bacterium]
MFFVYVLKSNIDNRLYKGLTTNLERRLKEHNSGKTKSTKPYRPWLLVYHEKFDSFEKARNRELYFKSGFGREYLKALLDS